MPLNGKYNVPLTRTTGEALLKDDLSSPGRYEDCVKNAVTYNNLNGNQYSALVSFTFNLGCGSLRSSTLLQKLNRGDVQGAADEFKRWNKAGGKVLPVLVKRRVAEEMLFSEGEAIKSFSLKQPPEPPRSKSQCWGENQNEGAITACLHKENSAAGFPTNIINTCYIVAWYFVVKFGIMVQLY